MSFLWKSGDNAVFVIGCGVILVLAVIFFVVVYAADYKESRQKARKRRAFGRAVDRAHRRRQKAH